MTKGRPWAMAPGLVGVLVLAIAGVGQGQLGIGGPGEGVKLGLLRLPAVQKELKLTETQKREVARIGDETRATKKQIDATSKGRDKAQAEAIPKGMPNPALDDRDAGLADLERRAEAALRKLLDAKQRARLSEIALQVEGPRAFLEPELIGALDLMDDQVEQIRAILGGVLERQEQAKAIQKRSADLGNLALEKVSKEQRKAQFRAIALKADKRGMAEIGKVLSKKQRDKYNRLLGEPFDLAGATDEQGRKLFDESADLASVLLKLPVVREELKLTVEQSAALDRDEPAARVLKPAQRVRLEQVALQAEGPSAFTRPDVARSLKLNDEQVETIEGILGGLGDARRQLREAKKQADEARKSAAGPGPDPALEKTRKEQEKARINDEADRMGQGVMSRIAAVLTRPQRDAFRKRLGEPFDLTRLRGAGARPIAEGSAPAAREGARP